MGTETDITAATPDDCCAACLAAKPPCAAWTYTAKSKTCKFDDVLKEYVVVDRDGINPRQDGNTVVLEIENAEARKNALWYRLHLQALAHESRMVRTAISGRGQ